MDSEAPSVNPLTTLKTCSACGAAVSRAQCHRNRYGEYICHGCQARGIRFTWHQRWRKFRKSNGRSVKWALVAVGAIVLTLLLLFRFLDQVGP
jgi:hypothetical protein